MTTALARLGALIDWLLMPGSRAVEAIDKHLGYPGYADLKEMGMSAQYEHAVRLGAVGVFFARNEEYIRVKRGLPRRSLFSRLFWSDRVFLLIVAVGLLLNALL